MMERRRGVRGWWGLALLVAASGCGPLETFAQGIEGPSEFVGRDQQWFLDNVGEPCSRELSPLGAEVWLYAQAAQGVELLACGTPGVKRSWAIYFSGSVCTTAMSHDRAP